MLASVALHNNATSSALVPDHQSRGKGTLVEQLATERINNVIMSACRCQAGYKAVGSFSASTVRVTCVQPSLQREK